MARQVRCPMCGNLLEWSEKSLFRPFCSERCKLTDLGAWASDAYRVEAQEETPSDTDGADGAPPATTH